MTGHTLYFGSEMECFALRSVIERSGFNAVCDIERFAVRYAGERGWQLVAIGRRLRRSTAAYLSAFAHGFIAGARLAEGR